MKLNRAIEESIAKSVLCWLATVSASGMPNVSPKEVFTHFEEDSIIIANIASPNTMKNIRANEQVCVSFIDVLVQKGFQLKGKATIVEKSDTAFAPMEAKLLEMTKGRFPFATITKIRVESAKPIVAPSYVFYPKDTTEAQQIENARKIYQI
ncbi:MAG: pyridoxamine 5'-phosphate oxidase family protein [Bacteroidota bacterium]